MSRGPWNMVTDQKVQAPSTKLQAASVKRQALKNIFESLLIPGPRTSNREA